jgi:S-formylglutathione hydrolase FrmB
VIGEGGEAPRPLSRTVVAAGLVAGVLTAAPPATVLWSALAGPAGMDAARLQLLAASVLALLACATWACRRDATARGLMLGVAIIGSGVVAPAAAMAWGEPAPAGLAQTIDWTRMVLNPLCLGAAGLVPVALVVLAGSLVRRVRTLGPRHLVAVVALVLVLPITAASAAPVITYGPDYGVHHVLPATPVGTGRQPAVTLSHGHLCVGSSTVRRLVLPSSVLGDARSLAVQLPPGYPDCAPRGGYPVLYLLHGDPGMYLNWLNAGSQELIDAGINAGAGPFLVVYPDGGGPRWTDWTDAADHRWQMGTFVATELVSFVDSHYLTNPHRQHRFVAGLSSGGFGAASLALRHPQVFGGFASFAGYYHAAGPAVAVSASPDVLATSLHADAVHAFIGAGTSDSYAATARAFDGLLRARGWHPSFAESLGGHGWPLWKALLWRFLPTVEQWSSAPPPGPPR